MKVSSYGVGRLENEIKELKAKINELQPQECDCSEPLTRGQRWAVIGTIATVLLSFTGVAAFDLVSNQINDNAANTAFNAGNGPWNDSQMTNAWPAPENFPPKGNWVACIEGSYSLIYDDNGDPSKDGMLKSSDKVYGPFTAAELSNMYTSQVNGPC